MKSRTGSGFTLVELLVALGVVAVLAALLMAAIPQVTVASRNTVCVSSLRQLGVATQLYLGDHSNTFFPYRTTTSAGTIWYFGMERKGGAQGEGARQVDGSLGPLFPYLQQVGKIEVCPSFDYASALWKPKFKGASWGYGYNWLLGGRTAGSPLLRTTGLSRPSDVVVFGDCAQVNTFQAPASPGNPLIEEFYIINETFQTIHFRHNGHANFLFADGHVAAMEMEPGTLDPKLPEANIGRITPPGSMEHLQ